jgi:hypothetical protein
VDWIADRLEKLAGLVRTLPGATDQDAYLAGYADGLAGRTAGRPAGPSLRVVQGGDWLDRITTEDLTT